MAVASVRKEFERKEQEITRFRTQSLHFQKLLREKEQLLEETEGEKERLAQELKTTQDKLRSAKKHLEDEYRKEDQLKQDLYQQQNKLRNFKQELFELTKKFVALCAAEGDIDVDDLRPCTPLPPRPAAQLASPQMSTDSSDSDRRISISSDSEGSLTTEDGYHSMAEASPPFLNLPRTPSGSTIGNQNTRLSDDDFAKEMVIGCELRLKLNPTESDGQAGLLAGKRDGNGFKVTHVLVPSCVPTK